MISHTYKHTSMEAEPALWLSWSAAQWAPRFTRSVISVCTVGWVDAMRTIGSECGVEAWPVVVIGSRPADRAVSVRVTLCGRYSASS